VSRRTPLRDPRSGIVLVNVLVVVAIASGALVALMAAQDIAIQRGTRYAESAQAMAVARGAEASAIVALRRDAREAPRTDHPGEAWGRLAVAEREIRNGRFDLAIEDAQAKFDINALTRGGLAAQGAFRRILLQLDLPGALADSVAAELRAAGPVSRLEALLALTLEPGAVARLAPHVTALPGPSAVNMNTAGAVVMAAMLNNAVATARLLRTRERQGFLTAGDVRRVGAILPAGTGFTSDHYRVTVAVTVGRTPHRRTSLLRRLRGIGGVRVVVVDRVMERAGPI